MLDGMLVYVDIRLNEFYTMYTNAHLSLGEVCEAFISYSIIVNHKRHSLSIIF